MESSIWGVGDFSNWFFKFEKKFQVFNFVTKKFNSSAEDNQETRARSYLDYLDEILSEKCYESVVADWAYETNINDENEKTKLEISLNRANFIKEVSKNITTSFRIWRDFKDSNLRRKLKKLSVLGADILPEDEYKRVTWQNQFVTLSTKSIFVSCLVQATGNWHD